MVTVLAASLACLAEPAAAGPSSSPVQGQSVEVQALADREAVVPGGEVRLAVRLKIDKGWYIYWQNPGSMLGLPTEVRWSVPSGFEVGPVRFPSPEVKFDKTLKTDMNILAGEPVIVTTVRAPASAKPGDEAVFEASASWLVCQNVCIPGDAELSLSLPIVAAGSAQDKPANKAPFDKAEAALPAPPEKAEHVSVSVQVGRAMVRRGETFTVTLQADVEPRHHMQSNKPLQEYLIPAVVFVELADGLDLGAVEYPKAHVRDDKLLGKLSEYSGKIAFKMPVRVLDEATPGVRAIRGVLQYQICSDAGTCFRPQQIEFSAPITIEPGEPVVAQGGSPTGAAGAQTHPGMQKQPRSGSTPDSDSPMDSVPPTGSAPPTGAETGSPIASPGRNEAGGRGETAPGSGTYERPALQRIEAWFGGLGYVGVLLLAMIGGIVLNLMPCVLPVISLKILSFVRQAKEDRARVLLLGVVYCAGILAFFGFISILFWATGRGWGGLFQSPRVVLALAAIVTAFALSLFGVFALFPPRLINELGQKAEGEGLPSAFFTGVLATFLGTACTAPFLSAAVGAASKFPPAQGAMIFFVVGIGMALPFFLLAANPGWLRWVPKPGPWMGTFERLMGFLLLGTVVWLLNPLRGQLGDYGLLLSLIFLLSVAIAAWIKGMVQFGDAPARRIRLHVLALIVLLIGWLIPFRGLATIPSLIQKQIERTELLAYGEEYRDLEARSDGNGLPGDGLGSSPTTHGPGGESLGGPTRRKLDWSDGIPWRHYRRSRALSDVQSGYTVFVDYTADWCVNCKVNKKASIEHPDVIALMKQNNVIPYEADYTLPVPEIKEDLQRFKRAGVPLYLIYKPGDTEYPLVLPEILTPGLLVDALKQAGPSRARQSDSH